MDPTRQAIAVFQEEFRAFRDEAGRRLLLVQCDPADNVAVAQLLRGEEWQPENKAPFLLFDTPYADPRDTYAGMNAFLAKHYQLLKKALADKGVLLREWQLAALANEDPLASFIRHVQAFHQNLVDPLQGLWVCWLPSGVSNPKNWLKDINSLLKLPFPPNVRFVIADAKGGPAQEHVTALGDKAAIISYHVDQKALLDFFKQMAAPAGPGKPHPGTMPGSARPDVEPPPRRFGPKQPSEDDLQAAIQAGKVAPVLLPSQGAKLRHFILEAASAAGENRPTDALKWQQQACELCAEAKVKLEQSLMTLVLASYLVQFKYFDKAGPKYEEAATLAEEAKAFPQVAQARLAYAYFLLTRQQPDPAAQQYEAAAEAATKGKSAMLAIEAWRLAGTWHLQRGRKPEALRCWSAAVALGPTAEPGELPHTSFAETGRSLVKLLREQKMEEQARSVEALLASASAEAK